MSNLLSTQPAILNLGISGFADAVADAGGGVVNLDWRPPARSDVELGRALASLTNHPAIEAANQTAYQRYLQAQPVLTGLAEARNAIPGFDGFMLLHSGPPIEWARMAAPVKGAIVGAMLYEGWAVSGDAAAAMAAAGEVTFAPCHHFGAVGPMAGVISPSMPVWIVREEESGITAFSNLNEGLGKVLRFGANSSEVLDGLRWMAGDLAPVLTSALETTGPIELKPLMAQALHMGDEVHNRNVAASGLFLKRVLPGALRSGLPQSKIAAATEFIAGNDHFFLNISMAACKAMLQAAHGIANSSLVTAMSRNGVEFGIRVSGLGDTWFTTDAIVADGLFFPGYTKADAAPDLGDSAIAETAGLGGFSMAAAPAIVQFVGGSPQAALAATLEMGHITLGHNTAFTLPPLNFQGSPAGIDLRKVIDNGIAPIINTGIAHREAGVGQIGAGITRAPMACFEQAVRALAACVGAPCDTKKNPA